jgi:hypothetical protein
MGGGRLFAKLSGLGGEASSGAMRLSGFPARVAASIATE